MSAEPLITNVCHSDSIYLMIDKYNLVKYTYEYNDAGEEQWIIEPNWEDWEKAGKPDIPGVNTDPRWLYKKHIRRGMPYALSCVCPSRERAMKANRADLRRYGMYYYDPIEFLRRTRGVNSAYGPYYFSKSPTDYLDVSIVTEKWIQEHYYDYCGREYDEKHGYNKQ